ncbi:hypothetical protein JTB14_024024 [Gonioctena quinquepunctata]|nr:hypothetical protein JTB14_024024 [Gonioctena quinquepunctata]
MLRKSTTYFKILKRSLHSNGLEIGVLGVPFDKGQPRVGVAKGPDALRQAGLIEKLSDIHDKLSIKDYGNITYKVIEGIEKNISNMKEYAHIASCNEKLSTQVEKIIRDGRICLTLGGDHAIAVGSVDGHIKAKNEDICILWVDAHADLNTNKTSPTGNVHGMPMALLASDTFGLLALFAGDGLAKTCHFYQKCSVYRLEISRFI